jgi:uncharacterized membrane protein
MSKFAIGRHPLHPMLVSLPIGLFVAAFAFDLVYLATDRDQTWYDAATFAGGFGAASAVVAALPGLGDYFTLHMGSKSRLVATLHLLTNIVLIGVFAAAFLLMLGNGATAGAELVGLLALHGAGLALLTLSGWLGGELIYVHQVLFTGPAQHTPDREEPLEEEPIGAGRRMMRRRQPAVQIQEATRWH